MNHPFAWSPGPTCNYPDCDGGSAAGYCHTNCRSSVPDHLFNRARFEVEHWNAICVDTGILLREQGFCPEKLQEELRG